jgi:hypothetical protein
MSDVKFEPSYIPFEDQLKGAGNFMDNGKFYLVRCYSCDPKFGRENYMPMAASGKCAWCGWNEAGAST